MQMIRLAPMSCVAPASKRAMPSPQTQSLHRWLLNTLRVELMGLKSLCTEEELPR